MSEPASPVTRTGQPDAPLRILWLKTGPLHPLDTGGKIRTYNMLRELRKRNPLTYLSLWPAGTPESARQDAAEYSSAQIWIPWQDTPKGSPAFFADLAANFFLSRLPYALQKYRSSAWAQAMAQADASGQFDLIVCDFLTPGVVLFAEGRRPRTPVLLFQHNVESLIWKRHFDTAQGTVKRLYMRGQWQRTVQQEGRYCSLADKVCAVSEDDARLLREEFKLTNVVGAVPTGVDLDFFQLSAAPRTPRSLVFLGSMDWMPNIDGCCWFADEIWPLVKRKFPDTTLTIVGRKPVPKVQELATRDASIRVTGTVDDVRPHLAAGEVMVVPLRVGGGTRIKIFEAMATGIPCVSTRIGAEGLPVNHGEHIALADTPADFAREICALFENPGRRQALGQNARTLVEQNFGWPSINAVFELFCRETVQAARR